MADEVTTTAKMDSRGRVVIPEAARESLGIDGEAAILELGIRVKD